MRITSKLATIALTSGLAVSGITAMAGPASAAAGGGTTANVGVTSGITMTGLTPSFTLTGAPGATITGLGAVTFNVETNNPSGYAVTVVSATATMLPALPATTDNIPIGALTVRTSGSGTYVPMSAGTAVQVHTQPGRSLDGGDSLSNDYQIRIPVVAVDTYSATLNYVATPNQ
jgi:hypothetical protein